jgi:cell division protein FtsL
LRNTHLKNIFFIIGLMMLAAFLFVAQVWKQNEYIKLSKAHEAYRVQQDKLQSDIANILLDIKKLKDFKRLETIGKKHFGMQFAGVPHFIQSAKPKRRSMPFGRILE